MRADILCRCRHPPLRYTFTSTLSTPSSISTKRIDLKKEVANQQMIATRDLNQSITKTLHMFSNCRIATRIAQLNPYIDWAYLPILSNKPFTSILYFF